jgi:hypothetical protein
VKLAGGCRCGALRYTFEGDLGPVANCHCAFCRRVHGAPFTTIVFVSRKAFAWEPGSAEPSRWTTPAGNVRQFCGTCAAPICNYSTAVDLASLVVASLPDAQQPRPWLHVNTESMAPHHEIRDDLPRFPAWPSADELCALARGRADVWLPEDVLRLL